MSNEIRYLMQIAKQSRGDAESLWQIASRLEKLGASHEASTVRQWAAEAERQAVSA